MLQVKHLSCGYGDKPIVRDMTFRVEKGERLCILGPNGCGKTTLLRGIMGILPAQGTVTVDGETLAEMPARRKARKIALMSQLSSAYFAYTVHETVMLGRYAHQKRSAFFSESEEDRRIVRESLEKTGMFQYQDRLITELSGGQLQRVFLAQIFAQDPRVVLLDEPTNHLDLKYQVELVGTLKDWVKAGDRCVVGVLHDINLALSFADRILLMEEGTVRAFEKTSVFDLSLLNRTYQTDVQGYMREALKRWQ